MAQQRKSAVVDTVAQQVEVLAAEDLAIVGAQATGLATFMGAVKKFFAGAKELEVRSKATLSAAKATPDPKTPEADLVIQKMLQRVRDEKAEVLEYWKPRAIFFQLHKALIAGEQRATEVLEEAATRWNKQHNAFAAAEKKRVDAERETERLRAEKEAADKRQAELDELERLALKAEDDSPELSRRESAFVELYLKDFPPHIAAGRAGYTDGAKASTRLLAAAKIKQAIEGARSAAALRQQASAVKEKPLEVQTKEVETTLLRAKGFVQRTTRSATSSDVAAFIEAVIAGKHGIPHDVLTINQTVLNEYARSMGKDIERWPTIVFDEKKAGS